MDTSELIVRASQGDADAWSGLVRRHAGLVYAVARAHGLREDQCDDVAQAVFATLVRRLASIRDAGALPAWLSTTARRESWRVCRADRRAALRADPRPGASSWGSAVECNDPLAIDAEITRLEDAHRVRAALETLDTKCRQLLQTLYFESGGENYALVAERLGMPVGSIGPTRRRCLAKLAELLPGIDGL